MLLLGAGKVVNTICPHEEVIDRCGRFIAAHESLPAVYSQAMGDYFYLIRSPEYDEIAEARKLVLA